MSEGWWDQFLLGRPVSPDELKGDYSVQIIGGRLPRIPQKWTTHKKRFEKLTPNFDGCNVVFKKEKWLGFFRLKQGASVIYPQIEVLGIDYSDPHNPRWMQPFYDEVVRLEDETLLGMAIYKIFNKKIVLCYFTLSM